MKLPKGIYGSHAAWFDEGPIDRENRLSSLGDWDVAPIEKQTRKKEQTYILVPLTAQADPTWPVTIPILQGRNHSSQVGGSH
jgi:hypothetical protein